MQMTGRCRLSGAFLLDRDANERLAAFYAESDQLAHVSLRPKVGPEQKPPAMDPDQHWQIRFGCRITRDNNVQVQAFLVILSGDLSCYRQGFLNQPFLLSLQGILNLWASWPV